MCYTCYNYDDDPGDDWDDEKIEYFHQKWLSDQAWREYAEEYAADQAPLMARKAAPKVAQADPFVW